MNDESEANKVLNIFLDLGFSEQTAQNQLSQLGRLVQLKIIEKIATEHTDLKFGEDDIRKLILTDYDTAEKKSELTKVALDTVQEYLLEITRQQTPIRKTEIENRLNNIDFEVIIRELHQA